MLLGRYVLGEIGRNFLFALTSTTGMAFFVISIVTLKKLPGVGLGFLAEIFPLIFPIALQFTVPLSMLAATLLTVTRITSDGELTALAAAGVSPQSVIVRPILAFAACVSLAALLLGDVTGPYAAERLRAAGKDIPRRLQTSLRAGLRDLKIGATRVSFGESAERGFRDICIERRQDNGRPILVRARSGSIAVTEDDELVLRLEQPRGVFPHGTKEGRLHQSAGDIVIAQPIPAFLGGSGAKRRRTALTARELAHIAARDVQKKKGRSLSTSRAAEELARRSAMAASAFFFALVGISLGVRAARRGGVSAFVTAMAPVLVIYFPLVMAMGNLAKKGSVPVYPALWAANLLFLVIGVLLMRRVARL